MDRNTNENGYLLAVRVAGVAGVTAIVAAALLLYDCSRRLTKDPLDSPAYNVLVAAVDQQPANEALKEQVRALDLGLRREYFQQRAFARTGAWLLLAAVAAFLVSAKAAATLHRRLPSPMPAETSAPRDREAAWTGHARLAVGGLCLMAVAGAVALMIGPRLQLPADGGGVAQCVTGHGAPSPRADGETAAFSGRRNVGPDVPSPAEDETARAWPRFRGPGGLGISAFTDVPETWDAKSGKGILWKTPVPLPGNNSPVVWGSRVFLSGADQRRREVFCFDADGGKLLWRQTVPGTPESTAQPPRVMEYTGYAASTTATDGRRVFAIFPNGDLAAYDFSGKLVWSKSLGMPENSYGHASSLATYKNTLLVQFDQGSSRAAKSRLLALDTATGRTVWQVARPVPNSWTSPIVVDVAGRKQIVTAADPWVIAYDADRGTEIWRANCLKTDVGVSPTFADGRVFAVNDNGVLAAIRLGGKGDVTKTHVLWTGEDGLPDICSPLATKEFVFLLTSSGTLTCYDAVKGGVLWAEDFEEQFASSPGLVGNRLYLVARTGKAWIVEPGRQKCRRVAEADLGESCVTSPAFQRGRIYLRGEKHLFCIGK